MNHKFIRKILVANRGEIAIHIFRAASELKIKTVAIYTHEDRFSLHRYKADEAFQVGADNQPLKPYLDIDAIIKIALENEVDAIHPGYGFLSENENFAQKCIDNNIIWVGPKFPETLKDLPKVQLFNLSNDPKKLVNLEASEPEKVKELTLLLSKYITEGRSTAGTPQENDIIHTK